MTENLRAIQFYERLGGVRAEKAIKRFFGNDVPNVKIVWDDGLLIKVAGRGRESVTH